MKKQTSRILMTLGALAALGACQSEEASKDGYDSPGVTEAPAAIPSQTQGKGEMPAASAEETKGEAPPGDEMQDPASVAPAGSMAKAYFASGCFWCVEAVYESVRGVEESISGYAGGHTENPTYESSNTGKTGHAEAVEIHYDPNVVSFATLVDVYFGSQDPTQVNGQGPDRGSQYRSIIFYQNESEKQIIDAKVKALEQELGTGRVAAEIKPFEKFWVGEDYHQNYERLHPRQSYIRSVSIPRLKRFQSKFPHLLKSASH